MKNRIIIAGTVLALAAGGGYAIKAHKDTVRTQERVAFVTDCRSFLSEIETKRSIPSGAENMAYDCVYRGAITPDEVTAAVDKIRNGRN